MAETLKTDICVIGAGSGGLSVAAGAVQMGAKVALIEKHKMGGDCLNYGCVPSKSLIKAAHIAHYIRRAGEFGIKKTDPDVSMEGVANHIKDVIAGIAPHDSEERFTELGCQVFKGAASFVNHNTVKVNDTLIKARYIVIAVGSHAFVPGITGLDRVPFFTNETIFDVKAPIEHLLVIGAGPIGCEIAQSYQRLGFRVSLLSEYNLMPRADQECAETIRQQFSKENIAVYEHCKIQKIYQQKKSIHVEMHLQSGEQIELKGSHIMIATGRIASLDGLNLERGGIKYSRAGIEIDRRLRTRNKRVFAIGDCGAGSPQFTHIASYHAGIVIRNVLFKLPAKVDYSALPWVTYTDPEFAHTGMDEAQARKTHGSKIKIVKWPFLENDRARAERETEGMIKVITNKKGVVLGCSIVGPHAGEMIGVWIMAVQQKMKIGKIAGLIFPYPTLGEVSKRVAGQYFTPALFSKRTRRIVRFLLKL